MVDRLVITTLDEPSLVYGMHGGEKLAQWKCLVRRNNLFGAWEAVEWAWLPPGGASGEHLHTRTEQLDFVVSGSGVMTIGGQEHPVTAGDVILTGLGTRHGIRNAGAGELVWLVTEVPGLVMASALPGQGHPDGEERDGGNAAIVNLSEVREVDAQEVLAGPLRRARLMRLRSGESETLVADTQEHVLFTVNGTGSAVTNSATVPLRHGVSVSLPFRGSVTIWAGPEGLECFVVSLAVPSIPGGSQ
ncbi:MAG: cupin domain-containing protein [Pseudonocardiaceae bacterium]